MGNENQSEQCVTTLFHSALGYFSTHTLGSISTTTPGPSVVELITFAALSWGTTLSAPTMTWFFTFFG